MTNVKLFQGLSLDHINEVIKVTQLKQFKIKDNLFKIGENSSDIYIIETGEVSISTRDENNKLKVLYNKSVYDYFGEGNFKAKEQRHSQATVTSKIAEIRVLNQHSIEQLDKHEWFKPVVRKLHHRSANEIAELIETIPFLSHVPKNKLKILGELFSFHSFNPGDMICKQGDTGDAFYIIHSGKLNVIARTKENKDQHVAGIL